MNGREVLAFDLYGTLVDPIAKQLEYSFRLTIVPALDRLPVALGG